MEPDDVMPNDYFLPREPQEQVLERKKEKAKTLEALKVTQAIIEHFDQRIEQLSKIDSIQGVSILTKPSEFQKAFLVNKLVRQALIEEKELLEEKIETYGPK